MTHPEHISQSLARVLAAIQPADWGKALDINHAFKIRQLKAGKLFTRKPPDFRVQLVTQPHVVPRPQPITDFFNPPKGHDHD